MLKVTKSISHSKDPEEVALLTVESIKTALSANGCSLFLINKKTNELELAASFGLSDEYLNKGPISALKSIAQSTEEGPVAIYDVMDDPRIQYPEEAQLKRPRKRNKFGSLTNRIWIMRSARAIIWFW